MSDISNIHHRRSNRHLLFPMVSYTPTKLIREMLKLDPWPAIRSVMSLLSGIWAASLYLLLSLLGCAVLDAVLFCVLAIFSAAALFWFAVPETWAFGSTTFIFALGLMAWMQRRRVSEQGVMAASALTLSMTTTNWMMGWIIAFVALPWRRALRAIVVSLALVLAFWAGQKAFFRTAKLIPHADEQTKFFFQKDSGGPLAVARVFALHAMVMPDIGQIERGNRPGTRMTVQHAAVGSGSPFGKPAAVLWLVLLGIGGWAMATHRLQQHYVIPVVCLTLLGQLGLHLVYGGEETFLYVLHWIPLLIVIAAWGSLTRIRLMVRVLAALCLVCVGLNNERQFQRAIQYLSVQLPAISSP